MFQSTISFILKHRDYNNNQDDDNNLWKLSNTKIKTDWFGFMAY